MTGAITNLRLPLAGIAVRATPQLQLARNERLFAAGTHGTAVYRVQAGLLRFERISREGARCIVRLAGAGELVGLEVLLGQAHGADAVACEALVFEALPRAALLDRCHREPALRAQLQTRWQQALDDAEQWQVELLRGPARTRFLNLLHRLERHADAQGEVWQPTRRDIGDMLDIALETGSRQLSLFRREGMVRLLPNQRMQLCREELAQALRD